MRNLKLLMLLFVLSLISCSTDSDTSEEISKTEMKLNPRFVNLENTVKTIKIPENSSLKTTLDKEEIHVRVFSAEYITNGEDGKMGNTVFFNNGGNKKLAGDFLPFEFLDESPNISYFVDQTRPSKDLGIEVTTVAIDRAMETWDGITCSDLGIFQYVPETTTSTGYIVKLVYDLGLMATDLGGSYEYFGDVVHSGWLPAEFFDVPEIFGPEGGSDSVLGVTFTIQFTDEFGNAVDLDNNGKYDVAWREIYYNDAFTWNDGSTYDVETIALHEAGHGLSQAHFGKAFLSGGNGRLHFSPRAVMNAAYSGIQTEINKTDEAGHCSNWASWPER
ncbi:hypothetical protein [Gramella sp. MAR_2010_147]|uniref:hypothetical protein n=1 Tax=Gramella sp. MAR_2010_147 TaxID=1250205 RepID=UPI00087A20D8|nr:hypothetical protein [Gramella sp. MAR_2010_147]SDR87399.1 hypothetical protein SAMN04488553_0915 [Gramella sp. MAR_2010_147]